MSLRLSAVTAGAATLWCAAGFPRVSPRHWTPGPVPELVRRGRRPTGEQQRQRQADPGQHGAGHEGGPVARGQHDERVRALVRGQVARGPRRGHGRDDGDAQRRADLQGGVAEARGEPGLVLGYPGERRYRRGHEGGADPETAQEQPGEDAREVAAVHGDLGEHQRPRAHERQAGRGDRANPALPIAA